MVLKGVNRVHNDIIGSNGLERSQLDTQYKNKVKLSWKESIGYTMIKLGQMVLKWVNSVHNDKIRSMVLKGVNCVHNDKMMSNGLERSQFGLL